MTRKFFIILFLALFLLINYTFTTGSEEKPGYHSPTALALQNSTLYVADRTAKQLLFFDVDSNKISDSVDLPAQPTGMTCAADNTIYITCDLPSPVICMIDASSKQLISSISASHGVCSPILDRQGKRLYVCNRFENSVSIYDIDSKSEIIRIPVPREPIAATLTVDHNTLLVANHLPVDPSDQDYVAALVTLIDIDNLKVAKNIKLLNGSTALQDICISPDGRYAYVSHILARFQLPTFQLDRGWMNTNALSIIDIQKQTLLNTVLLDDVDRGAANPWGVACSEDGSLVCVTHAGTHEVSLIDAAALFNKLKEMPKTVDRSQNYTYPPSSLTADDVPNDLSFIAPFRERISLKGNGPRALLIYDDILYAANYFSNDLSVINLSSKKRRQVRTISLGPEPLPGAVRRGEMKFHDSALCFQQWQSCASCHPDGRVDALNWDLLNDGIGNPKNTKSLLLSHETPPAMGTGVRANAEEAVRSGIKHILFLVRPERDALDIDEFLKEMEPVPSPYLENGQLTAAAQRGKEIFYREETACAACHKGELFTDLRSYAVGTRGQYDRTNIFDTPTLIELWRTGPYLHDGRATTLLEVFTKYNSSDQHGKTSQLSEGELDDLVMYLRSL